MSNQNEFIKLLSAIQYCWVPSPSIFPFSFDNFCSIKHKKYKKVTNSKSLVIIF